MTSPPSSDHTAALRTFLHSGFLWQLCWSSYWTLFFIRVVVDVGLDPLQLLLLGTTKEVTILLVEIPTGVVADIRSRRLSVILAFLICGAAAIGAGVANGFGMLVITQIVWAFGTTFRSGAETAWFTDEVGSVEYVDTVLPRRGRIEAIGSVVGLAGTALLAAASSLAVALTIVGGLLFAWGIWLILSMPETGFERHSVSARERFGNLVSEGMRAAKRPGLRVLLFVTVAAGFASEAVDRLSVARLDEIGLQNTIDPALLIGGATMAQSLATVVVLTVFGPRLGGRRLVGAMGAVTVATALGVVILARGSVLGIALAGVVVQGTARNVARMITIGWTNHFTRATNRATVHSFVGQAQSLGEISGGIVLGVVAQQVGIVEALTLSALTYLAVSAYSRVGHQRWDAASH